MMTDETQSSRPDLVHLRLANHLRERVEESSKKSGRSRTAEMMRLIERGYDLDALTAGGANADLLVDLFVAVRSPGGALGTRIMEVLDKHISWGELSTGIANVELKHR